MSNTLSLVNNPLPLLPPFPVFLIGGGWDPAAWPQTLRPFQQAAQRAGRCALVLILCAAAEERTELAAKYAAMFAAMGLPAEDLHTLWVSPDAPLRADTLEALRPTGLFVGGGLTPHYQQALCADPAWLDYLRRTGTPYAGFSAGAAIAASHAIVGGWQVPAGPHDLPILDADFGEDLDRLEVRPGLGLVPFAVEVHAGQWGTMTRLLHAVDQALVPDGWAVDENTLLRVEDGQTEVHGLGFAYHVTRLEHGGVAVRPAHAALGE